MLNSRQIIPWGSSEKPGRGIHHKGIYKYSHPSVCKGLVPERQEVPKSTDAQVPYRSVDMIQLTLHIRGLHICAHGR